MARGQAIGSMVFNKPQLIALDEIQPIIDYLKAPDRAATMKLDTDSHEEAPILELADFNSDDDYRRYKLQRMGINPDTMVGVLDISGSLMYRKGSMGANCRELTSYEGLKLQTQDMLDNGVESIVLMVDSGGGMAYGMFSAAEYIKKITRQAGVKTTAYVDGVSYSAAYGLSVLADEIVVNPQASVGSIGVVVALYNDAKALEKAGYTRQFIYAGENKIPFDNATGEFSDSFLAELQKSVDKTYGSFTRHISSNRNMQEQKVIDTQASVYDAEEALDLGLVDKIMELEDFEVEYGLKLPRASFQSTNAMAADNSQNSDEVTMSQTKEKTVAKDGVVSADAPVNTTEEGSKDMAVDNVVEMSELQKNYEELNSKFEDVSKKLTDSEDLVKELRADISDRELAQKTESRKMALETALGKDNDQVASLLESTESLSDEHFNKVLNGFVGTQEATQESFKELGGEGQEAEVQLDLAQQLKQMAATMNGRKA